MLHAKVMSNCSINYSPLRYYLLMDCDHEKCDQNKASIPREHVFKRHSDERFAFTLLELFLEILLLFFEILLLVIGLLLLVIEEVLIMLELITCHLHKIVLHEVQRLGLRCPSEGLLRLGNGLLEGNRLNRFGVFWFYSWLCNL